MASVNETLQTGLGALTSFSAVLSEVLGSIDGKIGGLNQSFSDVVEQLTKLSSELDMQNDRIRTLEAATDDNQSSVQAAMQSLQKDVEGKLTDASKSFHKEIVSQRALNKMDLNALRGKMTHSMSEAVTMLQDVPRLYAPADGAAAPPSSSTVESIEYLTEKIRRLEEAMSMQHTMNTHFSRVINSDEIVQKVYDSLYDQISNINAKQNDYRTENNLLKQQLREMKMVQREHERVLAELHQALVNEQRMDQLKKKISERKTFNHGMAATTKAPPMRRVPNTDLMNEELLYGNRATAASSERPAGAESAAAGPGQDSAMDGSSSAVTHGAEASAAPTERRPVRVTDNTTKRSRAAAGEPRRKGQGVPSAIDEEDVEDGEEADDTPADEERPAARPAKRKPRRRPRHGDRQRAEAHSPSTPLDGEIDPEREREGGESDERETDRDTGDADWQADGGEEDEEQDEEDGGEDADYGEEVSQTSMSLDADGFPYGGAGDNASVFSENNSLTEYYYGADYTRKLMAGFEQRQQSTWEGLEHLRTDLETRLAEVENTVTVFRRLALMIDDLKHGYETMRAKVDAVTGQESIDDKLHQSLFAKIKFCHGLWSRVHTEIVFGMDNIPEAEKDFLRREPSGSEAYRRDYEQKLFFKLSLDLIGTLDNALEEFTPRESMAATLKSLYPVLEKLYNQAEVLVDMDTKARQSNALDYCFDDILCTDLSSSLKAYVQEALGASLPILNECVATFPLYRQVQQLVATMHSKADRQLVQQADTEIRGLLHSKVEHQEFVAVTSKLASGTEVQRLQAQLSDRLSSAGGTGTHGTSMLATQASAPETVVDVAAQLPFQQLQEKVGLLAQKVIELTQQATTLVAKEEVHEALKAVIGEVKVMRRSAVTLPVFKEGLRLKADATELERLVKQMTAALGNINLTEFAASSSAVHAKCLLCDKPVTSQAQRSSTPGGTVVTGAATGGAGGGSARPLLSRSLPHLQTLDKPQDKLPPAKKTSGLGKLSNPQERAKVASEINILRSSVQPLPELTDSVESPRAAEAGGLTPSGAAPSPIAQSNYRNRIRSSAGGGMGPNYTPDTR